MRSTPPSHAMALLRSFYLVKILALQLGSLFSVLSDVSEVDAHLVTGVSEQPPWNDVLQVRDGVARKKVPRFMTELYEEHLRNPAMLQGNIVRSFAGA